MLKTHFVLMIISNSILSSIANSIEENILDGPQKLDKKGRFISFNNHEGEIKIELDFAIPFMKVPLRKSDGSIQHPTLDVNTRGLVTVGSMLFLFIAIVPKIVQLFVPQAQATATETFYPLMGRVEEALHSMDISTTECYQRAACWTAGKVLVNSPFSNARNSQWIGAMIDNDAIQEAFNKGMGGEDCSAYNCPLSMNVIAQMFKAGRQLLV